jgi:hypothetical protein
MKNTEVKHLKRNDELVGIRVTNTKDETFVIPVIDVRRSEKERAYADSMIKANNVQKGSKFMKPSYSWYGPSYNTSMKSL